MADRYGEPTETEEEATHVETMHGCYPKAKEEWSAYVHRRRSQRQAHLVFCIRCPAGRTQKLWCWWLASHERWETEDCGFCLMDRDNQRRVMDDAAKQARESA